MTDERMKLIEFPCPDCTSGWTTTFPILRLLTPACSTCGGQGKVLVDRSNLIQLSSAK